MACSFQSQKLSDLDPVTFFIVTEIMKAEQEQQQKEDHRGEPVESLLAFEQLEVA